MKALRALFLVSLTLLSGHAWAGDDDAESDRKVMYRQKTEIDFEGLEVEGTILKPQSALVLERKKASFNPLIKIRTDWDDMVIESVDEAK
jgi:hypothetical protein